MGEGVDDGDKLLLDILLENGQITESQKNAVLAEYEKRLAKKSAEVSANSEKSTVNEPVLSVQKKRQSTKSLTLSGRLHPQYDSLSSRLSNTDRADPSSNNRFHIRRAFVGISAVLDDQWKATYLTDFSDSKVVTQVARITWTLNDSNSLQFGYQKAPFGYEETTISSIVIPIERSASTRYWNESGSVGSWHTGVYYHRTWGSGWKSVFAVTNNDKGEADRSTSATNDLAVYLRLQNSLSVFGEDKLVYGLDLAQQTNGNGNGYDVSACAVHGDWTIGRNRMIGEFVQGELDRAMGGDSRPSSWFLQGSRKLGEKLELVGRVSSVDTDGEGAKLSTVIRRAPFSGFWYDEVDSLYLGANWFFKGNNVKFSLGYEYAEGSESTNATGADNDVEETIDGVRSRFQILF